MVCWWALVHWSHLPHEVSYTAQLCRSVVGLEWTSSHKCPSSEWDRSSCFGDELKTHPLPLPRDFSAPFSAPKFSLPTYFPPSYLPHLISSSLHLQSSGEPLSLSSTKLQGDVNTRLEEGGELNIQRMWRGESKRNASSQMQKRKRKGKLLPFSTFFSFLWYFFLCVFLCVLCLKRRRCREKTFETKG